MVLNFTLKKAILLSVVCFSFLVASGQSAGDYQSRRDGNWNETNMWQRYNGSSWVDVTNYPGELVNAGVVTLLSGDDVTLNVSPTYTIDEIKFEENNGGRIRLLFDSGRTLNVQGNVSFTNPSGKKDQRIFVDGGTLNCASINMVDTGQDDSDHELRITSGTVTVVGDITMLGSAARNIVNFDGGGILNIGGSMSGGGFDRRNDSDSHVNFNGEAGVQSIDGYRFENINFIGAANKVLNSNIDVDVSCSIADNSNLYCGIYQITDNGTTTFTLNNGATLGIGSPNGIAASTNIGNILLDTRNYSTSANYIYNGGVAQISGDGLPSTVNQLSVELSTDLTVDNSMTITSNLNLQGGRLIIETHDLLMLDGATISGTFDADHMIVVDGGTVTKQSTDISAYNMIFPLGIYSAGAAVYEYSPMVVSNLTGGVTGIGELSVKVVNNNAPKAKANDLGRYWEITEANLTFSGADVVFQYVDGDIRSIDETKYKSKRASSITSDSWLDWGSIDTDGNTLSETNLTQIQGVYTGEEQIESWYSFKSGNWDDGAVWTKDASGAEYDNDGAYIPDAIVDNVVILSGDDITMDVDDIDCNYLTVDGNLYLGTTIDHSFSKIFGSGRVYMQADNFPSGDATHFASKNQGEGTVIFQGSNAVGYEIDKSHTFYDVEIELANKDYQITLLKDLTINNNLLVKTGKLRINGNSDETHVTSPLNISVTGNVDVKLNGSIGVGTASTIGSYRIGSTMPATGEYHNIYHQFIINGDFINRGNVRLTNEIVPRYNQFSLNGGVTLRMQGASNNKMSLYGTTDLYNFVIEKGVDKTYELELYADNQDFFRLFGANNVGRLESGSFSRSNPEVRKALWIHQGTLKLTGSIHIPTLSEGSVSGGNGDYAIGEYAKLIISGANVAVYSTAESMAQIPGFETTAIGITFGGSNSALSLFGDFQIVDGTFGTRNSYGFVYWAGSNPVIEINGGDVTVDRLYQVGSGPVSYIQSGGSVSVTLSHFDLSSEDAVFHMSDGEIELLSGDFIVGSKEGNYNVTGGTIRFEMNSTRNLNSTANLYNLIINSRSGSNTLVMQQPLTALNDIYINSNSFLNHSGLNVTIGRDLRIAADALKTGNNYGYSETNNTLTFNGTENADLYVGHTIRNSTYELFLGNVILNKPVGKILTVTGDLQKTIGYQKDEVLAPYRANLVQIQGDLTIESGILSQGAHNIRIYGASNTVKANGQCGVYDATLRGTTHDYALIMFKEGYFNTEDGAVFGNLKINPADNSGNRNIPVGFTSDVYVKRIFYKHGALDLGTYNLKVDYLDDYNANIDLGVYAYSNYDVDNGKYNATDPEYIYTSGKASDGGLTIKITEDATYALPLGVDGKYTPAEVTITDFANDGYITIRPVDAELTTTNLIGGNILDYYWRVEYSDFTDLPTVQYKFRYDDSDDLNTAETTFYPGRVLDETPFTRSYEGLLTNIDKTNNIITFNDSQTTEVVDGTPTVVSSTGTGFTIENANYTAGVAARFEGAPSVYYSIASKISSCSWNVGNNWTRSDVLNPVYSNHDSRQTMAGDYPGLGDIAVIGWCPWGDGNSDIDPGDPHLIRLTANANCAQLVFTPMEDVSGNPREREPRYASVFRPCLGIYNGINLTTGIVQGEGMFWCKQSDPNFSLMDLGEFAVNDSCYILYENYSNGTNYNNIPAESPNLIFTTSGHGGNDFTTIITTDIKTNGNFEILGDVNIQLDTDAGGDITIDGNLEFSEVTDPDSGNPSGGGGELRFQNSGVARTITIGGDVVLNNALNQIYVQNAGGSNIAHQMIVGGNIIQTSTGNGLLFSTGVGNDHIDLTLNGGNDATINIDDGDTPELHRFILNKGIDQSTIVSINSDFNLNGSANGATKALELNSGTLIIENIDVAIDLTTGGDNFMIPSTSGIILKDGTLNASGTSGIDLDGLLQIEGGTLDMDGADNPIVYTASGNSTLSISGGELVVGGQIRRNAISEIGVLNYSQSGTSTVRVGTHTASVNNRGVFEVLGTGSIFSHTGGSLSVENSQSIPTIAAFYLNPEIVNIGAGSIINIGGAGTKPSQTIKINSSEALSSLKVDNTSANNPIAQTNVQSLTLNKNLEIDVDATFDAAGLDLSVGGNLTSSGMFTHNNNTTYFNGVANQTITGDVNFYNLEKDGIQQLILNASGANVDIDNNFVFSAGELIDNGNEISIQQNVIFEGTHSNNGVGEGVIFNGTTAQSIQGSGSFDVLTIDNDNGVNVLDGNQLTINDNLRLKNGVFNIDENLLVLSGGSSIVPVNPFSASNMIQTNISFTDNGVRKYFDDSVDGSIIYPLGAGGKYTPVSITMNSYTSTDGYITVKAANKYHPTITDPADINNVLQYHWILKSDGLTDFLGTIRMKFMPDDVLPAYSNLGTYINARLLADDSEKWNKELGYIDGATNELVFELTQAVPSLEIEGDYTAGLDAAIPDEVPVYISKADGDWNVQNTWDTHPVSGGYIPVGGPRGSVAIVTEGTNVTVTADAISSYKTTVNGTLTLGLTTAHRLGDVFGSGVLSAQVGDMPAGVYDDFIAETGGTLEYTGSAVNYSILGDLTTVNNLSLTGTGLRKLPDHNIIIRGDLVISDASLTNDNDINLVINKDFTFGVKVTDLASFDSGDNGAQTIFSGSALQYITGTASLTLGNGIDHFVINNPIGVSVGVDVDVDNTLSLIKGIIYNDLGNKLVVKSSSIIGGGVISYVQGPLTTLVNNGANFSFPIGDGDRLGDVLISETQTTGADYWTAEYFNNDASIDGKSHSATPVGDVKYVSKNEYWRVMGPVGSKANVTLRWDATSGVTPDESFRVVDWKDGATEWSEVGINTPAGNNSLGIVKTSPLLNFNDISGEGNYLTFGTITIATFDWKGLTGDWFDTDNWDTGVIPNASTDITLTSTGVAPIISNSGVAQVNNLIIDASASLTLEPGTQLYVNGDLKTNNNLVVNNTAAAPSSIITYGNVEDNATYNWPLSERAWWYVGHSVSGVTEAHYNNSFGASNYAVNVYDGGWTRSAGMGDVYVGTYPFDEPLEGYSVIVKNSGQTLSYSGVLNSDVSYSDTYNSGWRLVANPYPSYIDVEDAGFLLTDIDPTIYIRKSNNEVSTYNMLNNETLMEGSRFIAPGQCMWVRANSNSAAISIESSTRTHTSGGYGLKSASITQNDRLRLALLSDYGKDESVVIFNEDGSGFYTAYDSEKVMNIGELANLYSIKEDKNIAINSLPEITSDEIVPLGYSVSSKGISEFTIRVTNINDFKPEVDVYLEDKLTGDVINLRETPEYTFIPEAEKANDRFEIKFELVTTGIETNESKLSDQNVMIYAVQQKAIVKVTAELLQGKERLIEVYDLSGQLVSQHDLELTDTEFVLPQLNTMYIIKVSIDNNSYQEKVIALN